MPNMSSSPPKKKPQNGSLAKGERTACCEEMLTTAGTAREVMSAKSGRPAHRRACLHGGARAVVVCRCARLAGESLLGELDPAGDDQADDESRGDEQEGERETFEHDRNPRGRPAPSRRLAERSRLAPLLDLDAPLAALGALRDADAQHAALQVGGNRVRVHAFGQREGARELPVAAFDLVELLAAGHRRALAAQRQPALVHLRA